MSVALGRSSRSARTLPRPAAPVLVLALGMAAVAVVGFATALGTTAVVLDETIYKYAAARFADGLPGALRVDPISRGVAQLYSLAVTPIFAVFTGDVAVRVARCLNVALFVATAVPTYRLAGLLGARPWGAVAAGLGAIAVPWLTLSTIMFSEAPAYLLFACTILVMARTLRAPTWRWELAVVVLIGLAIGTRVQFLALAPAWVLTVLILERRRIRARFPVTAVGGVLFAVAGLVIVLGALGGPLERFGGPYAGLRDRQELPGDFGLATLFEIEMLALGMGVVPALLGGAWFTGALTRRFASDEQRRIAVLLASLLGVLFATAVFAQGGWLEDATEERYFIYAVPVVWAAAGAALARPELPARWMGLGGVALALCVAVVPIPVFLTGENAFLAPVSAMLNRELETAVEAVSGVLGFERALTGRDLLVAVVALLASAVVVVWRRRPQLRGLLVVPAVLIQLGFGAYAFSVLHFKIEGVGGTVTDSSIADMGWVDRATPGDPQVTLADNQTEPGRDELQRETVFWNDEVLATLILAQLNELELRFPVQLLGTRGVTVSEDLRLNQPPPFPLTVVEADSPLWQLAGRIVARAPDSELALMETSSPARLTWVVRDLDADGQITRETIVAAGPGQRVTVVVEKPPILPDVRARVRLGDRTRVFDSARGARQELRFDLCGATEPVFGVIEPVATAELPNQGGRFSGGVVSDVRVEPCD